MKKFLILSAFAFIAFGVNAQTEAAGKPGKATSETVEKKKEEAPQGKTAAATSQRSARVGQVKGGTDAPAAGGAAQSKEQAAGASCGKSGSQAAGGCCSKGGATAAEGKSGGCCSGASGAACGKGSTKPEKKQ
jgi:hypothetical protein